LRRWEELRPELDARDVALVAISSDTVEQVRAGRTKHGAQATMLADPDLEVTTLYNLINTNAVGPKGIGTLPIPTTVLMDAEGTVRWIDQTDDYMLRSAPERVLAALTEALG